MVEQFQVYITEFFFIFLIDPNFTVLLNGNRKNFLKKNFFFAFLPDKNLKFFFQWGTIPREQEYGAVTWKKRLRFALFLFTTVLSLWSLQPYVTHLSPHGVEITKHRENRETWCLVLTSQFRILVSSLLRGIIIHNNGFKTEHVFKNKGVPSKIQ